MNPPLEKLPMIAEWKIEDFKDDGKTKSFINFMSLKMNAMITDRTKVSTCVFAKEDDNKWFGVVRSIQDDRYPESKSAIRIFTHETYKYEEIKEDGVDVLRLTSIT